MIRILIKKPTLKAPITKVVSPTPNLALLSISLRLISIIRKINRMLITPP